MTPVDGKEYVASIWSGSQPADISGGQNDLFLYLNMFLKILGGIAWLRTWVWLTFMN